MLLSLVVWVGGVIFLSFGEAPTVFGVLPSRHMAGAVVGKSLTILHWMGLISGVVYLVSSMAYSQMMRGRMHPFAARHVLIVLMLLLTAVSQFGITPRMRQLRAEMAKPGAWHDSNQIEFDALHQLSTWAEGGVLLLGLGVVVLTARRFGNSN